MEFSRRYILSKLPVVFLLFFVSCSFEENGTVRTEVLVDTDFLTEEKWTVEKLKKEKPYDYFDTLLSNGYYLSHDYFQDNDGIGRYLLLKHGKDIIDTLNIMGYAALDKNLGYIGTDFKEYFAFVNSWGAGNPHNMKLIRKSTGAIVREGFILRGDEENELLLYQKSGDILIFDIQNMKDILLPQLDYKVMDWQLGDLITFKIVTDKVIELQYKNLEKEQMETISLSR